MHNLFLTGELKLPPSHFNLKRALAPLLPLSSLPPESWVPCTPVLSALLLPSSANFERAKSFCMNFTITCPTCSSSRKYDRMPIRQRIWAIIWCNTCQDTLPAHRWQCPCGLSWRSCPQHAQWSSFSTLLFSKRITQHRLDRRTNHVAPDSSSLLRQVHTFRAQGTFSSSSAPNTHDIYPCQESMPNPHKRAASDVLEHVLLKCPKLFCRFSHLASDQ